MRLWSIHPKYLDTRGLVALWREALLAKSVLQNKTRGYKYHPQLLRFKRQSSPVNSINNYLKGVWEEADKRNFRFDAQKIDPVRSSGRINVSTGQVQFEVIHLLKKLKERDKVKYNILKNQATIETHPLFKEVSGKIENWERI
ncbi:MAG: hypothetical protein JW728_06030 [Candidatus Aureabacteria bacterium]|nr:hypothetical protein [Candidatus Auribacterota bacterium]